jgi:Rad3-related DNA helicase
MQLRNGLPLSLPLKATQPLDFTVEMETGTGKTYVYLRTVFELNQRYGFTKFVVVVPSVAIKEGVNKTLQITREHFESCTPGQGLRVLPVRLGQAGPGAQLCDQPEHSDHGHHGRGDQQVRRRGGRAGGRVRRAGAARSRRTRCTGPARRRR